MDPLVDATVAPILGLFKEQLTSDFQQSAIFYMVATISLVLIVVAIGLIDAGLVRRKNMLDTWVQKIVCALAAGLGMAVIGYALWQIQFYQAFGVPDPAKQAVKDWWIGGPGATTFSQDLDPKLFPEADVFQVFLVFFIAYAMVGGALLHSAGLERVKPVPMYIISLVAGAIVIPIVLYYTWGSVSPLTNRGVHDYIGVYSLYIVVGVWALILAWRAGPRLGAFEAHPQTIGPVPHNLGWSAMGAGLLLFAAPFAFLGCGYLVPEFGYFGISGTTSGFGVVAINIFMSFIGGGLAGATISYRTKNPIMALIGIAAGYISAGASLDIGKPLEIFIVAFIGTFVVYGVFLLLYRLQIDDKKIVPLALGGGLYGALAAGVIGAGDKTGGYFGLKGTYALQNSEISIGWQLAGIGVTLAIAVVSGLALILVLEKTIGLRVKEPQELKGLDDTYWKTPVPPYQDAPSTDSLLPEPEGPHVGGTVPA